MKTTLKLLIICLFCGCASIKDKEARCAQYKQVYELYQLSLLSNRTPSKDEVAAATAAAIFLSAYCGWQSSSSDRGLNVDVNGVPIVYPTE